tara:strand:+ start:978 stop:1121 length:144 start_codon:yes stop_codon:yes gene_type:complete
VLTSELATWVSGKLIPALALIVPAKVAFWLESMVSAGLAVASAPALL